MQKQKKFGNKAVLAVIIVIAVIAGYLIFNRAGLTGAATSDNREDYKIDFTLDGERYTTERVFKNLPQLPQDFWKVRILVLTNVLRDLSVYGPEYWSQPEWEPAFLETCLPRLEAEDFPKNMRVAGGYGFFPVRQGWVVNPGDTISTMTVIRSACFVSLYQGVGFDIDYPDSARFRNEQEIWYSDPDQAKNYVTITFSPKDVVMGPMFPIIAPDYAQKIDINVTLSPDTPPGKYIISLKPTGTSYEFSQAMYRKYLNNYDDTGSRFQVGGFTLFIEVVPTE